MNSTTTSIIHRIIREESILIEFQPIVSLKLKKTVGVEALARGIHPESGKIIPPYSALQRCN